MQQDICIQETQVLKNRIQTCSKNIYFKRLQKKIYLGLTLDKTLVKAFGRGTM